MLEYVSFLLFFTFLKKRLDVSVGCVYPSAALVIRGGAAVAQRHYKPLVLCSNHSGATKFMPALGNSVASNHALSGSKLPTGVYGQVAVGLFNRAIKYGQ